jgi:hypothetical protein
MNTVSQHFQLFNHLYPVPKPGAGLPTVTEKLAPFSQIHDRHQHEVEGEETYALPVDETVSWLVAHKGDPAARNPVECMLHKRHVLVNTLLLCGESFDQFKARVRSHVVDPQTKKTIQQTTTRSAMPAPGDEAAWDAFALKFGMVRLKDSTKAEDILTVDDTNGDGRLKADGPSGDMIIPVDLHLAGQIFGFHHFMSGQPRDLGGLPHGGLHSVTGVNKFDEYLSTVVGLKSNHDAIKAHPNFCFNCKKTAVPQAPLPDATQPAAEKA